MSVLEGQFRLSGEENKLRVQTEMLWTLNPLNVQKRDK